MKLFNNSKTKKPLIWFLIPFLLCSVYYPPEEVEIEYEPIIMKRNDLEQSVSFQPIRDLNNPGKIYLKDNYIYINERFKGVHVIDNSDPTSPVKTGFIRIPGCQDIAIMGNYLYADNAVDLITIDISSTPSITITSRIRDVYPDLLPPDSDVMPTIFNKENRPENTIIIEWVKKGSPS
ncbi:MAG: hypothetical protein JXB49_26935 [Bacteroidales bacterium]|nr:hypothetical protein [Bacteroidales bacterium]